MPSSRNSGLRYQARKDLRDYDNPKAGRNPLYGDKNYLQTILAKYNMSEEELREFANSARYERAT